MTAQLQGVASRIAFFRIEAGLTGADLARALDVTPQAVSAWERGIAQPTVANLHRIADAVGVPVRMLLDGDRP